MKKSYRRSKGGAGEEEDKEDSILNYEEPTPAVATVETPGLLDKVKSWFGGSRNKRVRFRMTRKRSHKRTHKRSSTKRTKRSSTKRSSKK